MPDRVVPLQLCPADHQAQGQVVLPQMPGGQADRHEAEGGLPQGARRVQQDEGGEEREGRARGPAPVQMSGTVCRMSFLQREFEQKSGYQLLIIVFYLML